MQHELSNRWNGLRGSRYRLLYLLPRIIADIANPISDSIVAEVRYQESTCPPPKGEQNMTIYSKFLSFLRTAELFRLEFIV